MSIYIPKVAKLKRPKQISYTRLGVSPNGKNQRIWQEGIRLASCGFEKGVGFKIIQHPENYAVELVVCDKSEQTNTVSGRKIRNKSWDATYSVDEEQYTPIVDISSAAVASNFSTASMLRCLYYDGRIVVQASESEISAIEAMEDLEINSKSKRLTLGVIGFGGGIFSEAIKTGAALNSFEVDTEWVLDIEQKYLQSALDNTNSLSDKSIVVHGDATHVESDLLTPVNILMVSAACTGFSSAGKAKNQLDHAEEHKTSGLMIHRTLDIIQKFRPPIIWHENVVEFKKSASAAMLYAMLKECGYRIQSQDYDGSMGTLENRKRNIICATHTDLDFNLADHLVAVTNKPKNLGEVLENIPEDSPLWKSFDYLVEKEKRDIANGKGFRMQKFNPEDEYIGTLTAGMHKMRSTDPKIAHPTNPALMRALTIPEHARCMGIPDRLVRNLSYTRATQVLGQAGSFPLLTAIGAMTARRLDEQFNDAPTNIVTAQNIEDEFNCNVLIESVDDTETAQSENLTLF